MATRLNPYLNFRGQAKEAMEFYAAALGGELTTSTFAGSGMPVAEGEGDWIMHGQLETPSGFTLMGSDVPTEMQYTLGTNSYSVSLSGDDDAELRGYWNALAEGAEIGQPLVQAPWGDTFGMLTDRFGVNWMVNILGAAQA